MRVHIRTETQIAITEIIGNRGDTMATEGKTSETIQAGPTTTSDDDEATSNNWTLTQRLKPTHPRPQMCSTELPLCLHTSYAR